MTRRLVIVVNFMPLLLFTVFFLTLIWREWPRPALVMASVVEILLATATVFFNVKVPHRIEWAEENLCVDFVFRREEIPWSNIESFFKLWVTQRLDGEEGDVATIVKYRRPSGLSARMLLVVRGKAAEPAAILPSRYKTIFDLKVPDARG